MIMVHLLIEAEHPVYWYKSAWKCWAMPSRDEPDRVKKDKDKGGS